MGVVGMEEDKDRSPLILAADPRRKVAPKGEGA